MKKKNYHSLIIILFFLICGIRAIAQPELWGLASQGGTSNAGTIFKIKTDGSGFSNPYIFDLVNGSQGRGSLMHASNGKIYGTTTEGGSSNSGVLFSYDPTTSIFTKLLDFDGSGNGANPTGGLIELGDGKLYGTATNGGPSGGGMIFSYDPVTSVYAILHSFLLVGVCGGIQDGNGPSALMKASDGKLYGAAGGGGASANGGIVFCFDPTISTYTQIVRFGLAVTAFGSHGPRLGALVQANNGRIYGLAAGGANNFGTIYSFNPSSGIGTGAGPVCNTFFSDLEWREEYSFAQGSGINPQDGLFKAADGKLYGTTPSGGSNGAGVIFSYDPNTLTYAEVYAFGYGGAGSYSSLMQGNDGKLYGTTINGGQPNGGLIFSFDYNSNTFTELKGLANAEGVAPIFGKLLEVSSPTPIPTMPEWSLILLGGLLVTFGVLYVKRI